MIGGQTEWHSRGGQVHRPGASAVQQRYLFEDFALVGGGVACIPGGGLWVGRDHIAFLLLFLLPLLVPSVLLVIRQVTATTAVVRSVNIWAIAGTLLFVIIVRR